MINEMLHTTKDGTKIKIADMGDGHLLNTIRLCVKRSKEGIVIRSGGPAFGDLLEMWYEEEHACGQEALDYMGFEKYTDEAENRGLIWEN